ncbi:MAG TPA: hypothetical protein VHX60_11545 [Acidobacteriaceae bacterium]|nr:hypothetical protein [Acidobacteriaceae bacterium]
MKIASSYTAWIAVVLAMTAGVGRGQATASGSTSGAPVLRPFVMDHRAGLAAPSPVDVSFLLDAPAGKHGFIHAAGGHLVTGEGQRIRLWGVNLTEWSPGSTMIPSKQDAHLWAATLARYGVNCVRLQFLDLPAPRGLIAAGRNDTRAFDPEQLDREDYFLAELEKRGIYIDLNLLVGRPFKAGDGVVDADKLHEGAKAVSLYDKTLIELQKDYARQLLTHVNPYTKRSYAADPAVAIVEINNENAIWLGFPAPSPFYAQELDAIYNGWLQKGASAAEMWSLRKEAGVQGSEPIPLLNGPDVGNAPKDRFDVESRFFLWLESGYFSYMRDYLRRNLGIRCLILATADHSHHNTGYPLLLATSSFDAVDGHDYWQHPWEKKVKSPMVDDPLNSTVVELSRTAEAGKPYTVSEVNEAFPNDYGAEQIPILAAYGDLEDWDAILWYTFEPKKDANWKPYIGDPFDISLDPIKMPELAAGALTFLRGDVSAAQSTVLRSYSEDQVFDSYRMWEKDRPYFTPGFPLWIPLEHGSRIAALDDGPTQKFPGESAPSPIVADTAQLAWSWSKADAGQVAIDTPRMQALIGFSATQGKLPANLSVEVDNPFRAIELTSLDAQPIARSGKMLLVAGARVVNTGMQWNAGHTGLAAWGGSPTLIEPVTGHITLHGLAGATGVAAQPLDGSGQPLGPPIQAVPDGDGWVIPVGTPATTWYAVSVQR